MRTRFGALGRHRPLLGIVASILLHALLIFALFWVGNPGTLQQVKRGEPLFVELPNIPEPAPRGNPAARETGPAPAPKPEPKAAPPARPAAPSKPSPPVVAKARPEPAPPKPAPAKPAPEPERAAAAPAPATPAPPKSEESGPLPEVAKAAPPASTTPSPDSAPTESARRPAADPRVAVAPSPGASGAPDLRSLRPGGGAGGTVGGRGGIEGEPVPLDSRDPRFSEYLDRIRRMIKEKWGYPCVKNEGTRECEYKTAVLVIEFGISRQGVVPFVHVMRTSGYQIYDDYAVNAIKLAAPFPPMPPAMGGPKGVPIVATFSYVVDSSLVNLLR